LFVKNPDAKQHGQIYYHDIGDDLNCKDKLEKITNYASIAGISESGSWQSIIPDQHGDWLKQRDDRFSEYIVLGNKDDKKAKALFANYSGGVKTNRDAWCYNAAKTSVFANMTRMIAFYNSEVDRFTKAFSEADKKAREASVDDFINTDPTQISWNRSLKQALVKNRQFNFDTKFLVSSLYRPFTKQWLYFNRQLNDMVYQIPRIFPDMTAKNRVICVSGIGARSGFSALIADTLPCLDNIEKGQCFPLYLYEDPEPKPPQTEQADLFSESQTTVDEPSAHLPPLQKGGRGGFINDRQIPPNPPFAKGGTEGRRRDAITDEGLAHFQAAYPGETISKEDLFYYVYGLLHSPDYRERYADNLAKELPRIPCVHPKGHEKTAADFWAFSQAGRKLAELHINYETVEKYPLTIVGGEAQLTNADYRVEKMKYGKNGKDKDLTTLHYNAKITLTGIPLEAYDYIVNGKPALDWVVERQCVKTDKDSGIVNDANDWAIDTMNNPRYPLELFQRVVTVSLETMKIVKALPALNI